MGRHHWMLWGSPFHKLALSDCIWCKIAKKAETPEGSAGPENPLTLQQM